MSENRQSNNRLYREPADVTAFREAARIVADCAAQGLGLVAAERALIREADRLAGSPPTTREAPAASAAGHEEDAHG